MLFFRGTWGEWNKVLLRLPRPKKKKKPIGSYYTADFYFEVTQNSIPSEHYSFRAKYTAEPPGISIELTVVSKYHHSCRLRKAILSAISSTCRPFIVLSKIPITGVKIYLVLAAQSSSPENKFNHCFFFSLLPFFSFPLLFAFYFLFCRECQGRSQPIVL